MTLQTAAARAATHSLTKDVGEFCLFIEFGGSWRDRRGGMAYPRELNEIFSSSVKVALTAMTQRLGITTLSHHSDCGYLRYYYCLQFQRHSTSNSCLLPFETLARPTHFENQFEVSQQLSSMPRISCLILLFCLENWDSKLSLSPWAENSKTTTQSLIRTDLPWCPSLAVGERTLCVLPGVL